MPPVHPEGRVRRVAVLTTILIHLLLFSVVPDTFVSMEPHAAPGRERDFEINLMPEIEEVEPWRFVETNPDAPENEPDRTEHFAAQNQQAAQPEPDLTDSDMPRTEGEEEPSTQIVTGEFSEPVFSQPSPEQLAQMEQAAAEQMAVQEQIPLPGYEQSEGEDPEGVGLSDAEVRPMPAPAPEYVEGVEEGVDTPDSPVVAVTPSPPSPQPRPRLQQVRPGILQERPTGVSMAGMVAVDARFSEFGDYLQELIETVQIQWDRILSQSQAYPASGSRVAIRFRLNSHGEVEILDVSQGAGSQATYASLNAITSRQPYRPWTRDMVNILGTSQELTFTFHYR